MSTTLLPVTMAATRRALPGQEAELERWAGRLCAAASTSVGYQTCDVHCGYDGEAKVVTVTLTFTSATAASTWEASTVRASLLEQADRLTDGAPAPADLTTVAGGSSRIWTAVVVWAGLTPFALVLNILAGPALNALPVVPRTLLTTVLLVPLALFVGVPLVNRGLAAGRTRARRRGR